MGRDTVTVPSALVGFRAEKALTPGMHAIVLRLADQIDRLRLKVHVVDALWLELATADLRPGGRDDNHWLRQWLTALTGVRLSGELEGHAWGAVLVAEWHIENGGRSVRVLVPPAAVNALAAPATFAKVETECLFRLRGAARELYLVLADKKRLSRKTEWDFDLPELRAILGVGDRKSYERWDNLLRYVLKPAVAAINDLGTVNVTMEPKRDGRSIGSVRFKWRWKTLDEAEAAAEQAERHSSARRKPADAVREAPPLIDGPRLSVEERRAAAERAGVSAFLAGREGGR